MVRSVKKRKIAVFDIDGTIYRSSWIIELTDALIQEGFFPAKAAKIYARSYKNWLERKDDYEKYIQAVVVAFNKYIQGVSEKDFSRIVKKVVRFHKNRVYRYTRDLIRELKKKNYFLLGISGSPKEIVQEFGKYLGFDKVYGRVREIGKSGKFTGTVLYLDFILDKAQVLKRVIDKENMTLKGSIGVGDTGMDVSFLKLVDKPICFNPNKSLYQYARRRGWLIVVERKDVIYKIYP